MNNQNALSTLIVLEAGRVGIIGRPENVLHDLRLTSDEKRAVLAGWASDAHAVEGSPALRRIDDGSIVHLDEILSALRSLDEAVTRENVEGSTSRALPRRHRRLLSRLSKRWGDQDDDPPPSPACASIPVHFALADAIAA